MAAIISAGGDPAIRQWRADRHRASPPRKSSYVQSWEPIMSSHSDKATAEERLKTLGIELPRPPSPLGAYVEAVQTGNLLFLSGTLPVESGVPRFQGRLGRDLSVEEGRRATHLAALNALAAASEHLGSLDKVSRVVRLAVSLVTTPEFRDHPKVADAASELLVSVFGRDKTSTRMVYGMTSLPAGVCVVVELILEVGTGHSS
jgi:enamine deaminase RidA (YjgF/YER057c/UK114 family)